MKGFYSREKRLEFEQRLRKEQEKFEQDHQRARQTKQKITIEANILKEY